MVERRIEQLRHLLAARRRRVCAGVRLRLHDERQAIEKLPHAWRERRSKLVERATDVLLKRRGRQALDERAREVQRAQLGQREACLVEPLESAMFERPVFFSVVGFVEQRKACRLQRLEVATDRSRRDAGARRQVVDREPARRFEVAQDRPLPDDFGVPRHTGVRWLPGRPRHPRR